MQRVRRALLSVSDKTSLVELARRLGAQRFEILSTGGTARALRDAGIAVTEVADYTGFPEIMDGRIKTLHPRIHAALLARRGVDDATIAELGIDPIDLLVVNLYPFRETVARAGSTLAQAVEQIDVGGPAMLRAAAKNHDSIAVVIDPADYARVATEIEAQGRVSEPTRRALAVKAFQHTADYDRAIAEYLALQYQSTDGEPLPSQLRLDFDKACDLRYGENPHQRAAFYVERTRQPGTVAAAQLLQGKELSFNNLSDADAALAVVREFDAAALRDRQARESLRCCPGRRPRERLQARVQRRPEVGLRRRHRLQPHARRASGAGDTGPAVRRGHRRARDRRRCACRPRAQAQRAGARDRQLGRGTARRRARLSPRCERAPRAGDRPRGRQRGRRRGRHEA
jgi:hypothetical protein